MSYVFIFCLCYVQFLVCLVPSFGYRTPPGGGGPFNRALAH